MRMGCSMKVREGGVVCYGHGSVGGSLSGEDSGHVCPLTSTSTVALVVALTLYCVVYLIEYATVHLTAFPILQLGYSPSTVLPGLPRTTRSSLHTTLTHSRTKRARTFHKVTQKKASLCISTIGGMGNAMFQYASMFGIAKSKNMTPMYHDSSGFIQSVFSNASAVRTKYCFRNVVRKSKQDSAFNEVDVEFSNDKDATLNSEGYYQSWRYFQNYIPEIRREFRIKDHIKKAANNVIHSAVSKLPPSSGGTRTYIMIHARRGLVDKRIYVNVGYMTPSPTYYHKAMDWYRQRYTPLVFVVCSDSIKWTKQHLKQKSDVVFIDGKTMEVDFAILSLGNHTIMSVGTFGWWGSFLAGGETIAYRHPGKNGSYIRKQFSTDLRDFYLPHWILMDDS